MLIRNDLTLEHIDPRKHPLIGGLRNDFNEVIATRSYNSRKNNWFVPYRVCKYPAPVTFGDMGEFLIQGIWCVLEFGGRWWLNEAKRLHSLYQPKPWGLTQDEWEEKIREYEIKFNLHIIVCSENGIIHAKCKTSKSCIHGRKSGGQQLSQVLTLKSCCKQGKAKQSNVQ